jgi:uncharacterized membrane protein YidH (DUF202 family)
VTVADAPDGPPQPEGPPGLQRERTLLAWNRSLLALIVTVVLLVRTTGAPYLRLAHLPALLIGGAAVWLSVAADVRYRRGHVHGQFVSTRHLAALATAVAVTGVAATVALALA